MDDAFVLFGTCCLICSVATIFPVLDTMYMMEGILYGVPFFPPADIIKQAYRTQRFTVASLMTSWLTIVCIKFSFLALFRKLVDRSALLMRFWWVAVAFNLVVSGYGLAVYILICRYSQDLKACESAYYGQPKWRIGSVADVVQVQCVSGPGAMTAVRYSLSQMVVDIVGDALSMFPVNSAPDSWTLTTQSSPDNPDQTPLATQDPTKPKASLSRLPLPHRRHDCRHHHPSSGNDVARHFRRRLGDLLAARRFSSWTHPHRGDILSHVLHRSLGGKTATITEHSLPDENGLMESLEDLLEMAI